MGATDGHLTVGRPGARARLVAGTVAAVALAAVGVVGVVGRLDRAQAASDAAQRAFIETGDDGLASAATGDAAAPSVPATLEEARHLIERAAASVSAERARAAVATTLADLRALHGYAGVLDYDAAKALLEGRRDATTALEGRLAALGPEAVGAIVEAYGGAQTGREKLLLIGGLARGGSPESARALADLLDQERGFSYRRALIDGLGASGASNAGALLADVVANEDGARERITAIRALDDSPEAALALAGSAAEDPDSAVRVAAVGRLSQLGGDGALAVLTRLARDDADYRVRSAAILGLARAFPQAALGALEPLTGDADAAIREALVAAVARLRSEAAATLLLSIAQRDPEASVRTSAERALARMAL